MTDCGTAAECRFTELLEGGGSKVRCLCESHKLQEIARLSKPKALAPLDADSLRCVNLAWFVWDANGAFLVCLNDSRDFGNIMFWTGYCDGVALIYLLEGHKQIRPMTQQAFYDTLEILGYKVKSACLITHYLVDNLDVYEASVILVKQGQEIPVNMRPSDAICLATLAGAPIFAVKEVFADLREKRPSKG